MLRTILILLFSIIVVPTISIYSAEPLFRPEQFIILKNTALIAFSFGLLCFVVGQLSGNNSQTDKIWGIAPVIYAWYMAYSSIWGDRMILMAVLTTIWGARLTYIHYIKGGYSWKFWAGKEYYRWALLRETPFFKGRKVRWSLFNLFFVSLYQNGLIFLLTLPMIATMKTEHLLNAFDTFLAVIFILLVFIEGIADRQQQNFQKKKYALINKGKELTGDYSRGFLANGLWSISRHPNYAADQAVWVVFYLFSVVATGHWINWSIVGCLLLIVFFKGSTDFSEGISASKYPRYKEYQKEVPRFFPVFW